MMESTRESKALVLTGQEFLREVGLLPTSTI